LLRGSQEPFNRIKSNTVTSIKWQFDRQTPAVRQGHRKTDVGTGTSTTDRQTYAQRDRQPGILTDKQMPADSTPNTCMRWGQWVGKSTVLKGALSHLFHTNSQLGW